MSEMSWCGAALGGQYCVAQTTGREKPREEEVLSLADRVEALRLKLNSTQR